MNNQNKHICDYGCGREANFQFKNGKWCCSDNISKCPAKRNIMSSKLIKRHNILKGLPLVQAVSVKTDKLCEYGCGQIAKYMFKNGKYCCCDNSTKCPAIIEKASKKIKKMWQNGFYDNSNFHPQPLNKRKRSYITKQKISKSLSLKRKNIETYNKNKIGRCKIYKFKNIKNKEFSVQGKWELNIAKYMNDNNIYWIRRSPLKYYKDNILHFYHPDFFIPKYNFYIEVKGYFSEENKLKMNLVMKTNPDAKIIFINTEYYYKLIKLKISIFDIPFYSIQ